jgi:A/G-specific adenine glycosylase
LVPKIILISQFHRLYKSQGLSNEVIKAFQDYIYAFYRRNKRDFPFRRELTPYKVLVSEIMLQQTQTSRVSNKFLKFIEKFKDFDSLAQAKLEDVLATWQGLGYNRRAIALKKIAEKIVNEFEGTLPADLETLKSFPQIGHNTASSILTFAFNIPTYFIETNIRRVYIYFFFSAKTKVQDNDIMEIVKETIDLNNPREWYYALMDYGVMLKKTHPELNKKSAHYRKQSKFTGSIRETRGMILNLLLNNGSLSLKQIINKTNNHKDTIKKILNDMKQEGFVQEDDGEYTIPK